MNSATQRYAWVLQYDGRGFCGWQAQPDGNSIQQALTSAIYQATGCIVRLVGASRTDAGVSAKMQVAHADLPRCYKPGQLMQGVQRFLRPGISVVGVVSTSNKFHARRSAAGKVYEYTIWDRPYPPVLQPSWWVRRSLCPIKINQALQCCVGTHDFTSFQHAQCVQNPVRTIESINVRREAGLVRIEFRGRSFVMHQIRRIVGTVVEWVMSGGIRGADRSVSDVLRMQDRRASGQTAPGVGLLLKQILYPGLPEFVADAGDCDD